MIDASHNPPSGQIVFRHQKQKSTEFNFFLYIFFNIFLGWMLEWCSGGEPCLPPEGSWFDTYHTVSESQVGLHLEGHRVYCK